MTRLPQRASLAAQTVEILREQIATGVWSQWLPGELELLRRLQVSRGTIRTALLQLQREGWIRGAQGRRREIVPGKRRSRPTSRTVVLLTPVPLHAVPAAAVFWIDELRERLEVSGWSMEVHESAAAYRRRAAHALEAIASRIRPAGWVLYRSTPEMQQWFATNASTAVIAGSRHEGVALPSLDVDYEAACRHAAGQFRAQGHRRLALIRPSAPLAGDLQSEAGFSAGAKGEVTTLLHAGTVRDLSAKLTSLIIQAARPTALLVFHATHLLTTLSWLQKRGIRVPQDVSLIGRDDDAFLDAMIPRPARYSVNARSYARKLSRMVCDLLSGVPARQLDHRLMPEFLRGETLGAAPDLSSQ